MIAHLATTTLFCAALILSAYAITRTMKGK